MSFDDLLLDADTRRCWREVVTGEEPMTIDGLVACYGSPDAGAPRAFGEGDGLSDDQLYAKLSAMHGVRSTESAEAPIASDPTSRSVVETFGPSPDQLIAVPEHLVQQIDRNYDAAVALGLVELPEDEFDRRAHAWLMERSGGA